MQMQSIINKSNRLSIQVFAITIFIVFILFIWQGNKDFSLSDEGFLWYGAQRVMLGEVPLRDFMSYDPGRYYWSAALMILWGDNGIMALRGAEAIFQALGLFVGLSLIASVLKKQNFFYLLLSAITLVVWMFRCYKVFDYSLSILLIGILTFLIHKPMSRTYFFAGLCVGLVAIFGRNHGLYGIAGSFGVMFWLSIKQTEGPGLIKGFVLWVSGALVGFSPLFFMAMLVPGFASAFLDSIHFLFESKATNIPLPIPWPWLVDFSSERLGGGIRGVLIGLLFIAIVAFGALSIVWVLWQKNQNKLVPAELVAVSFLILPYAHYAYSRADIDHLALGIFPFLVGCLVLLATLPAKFKWPMALTLCATSLLVVGVLNPGWKCHNGKSCVNVEISGSAIQVDSDTAGDIGLLRNLSAQYGPDGQNFIATPAWPGAYALLERKSPMFDIYALLPRSKAFEQAEINRIKVAKPSFVLVFDFPLDGHDELRFRNTHPLVHQYILDNFESVSSLTNPAYQIYKTGGGMQ